MEVAQGEGLLHDARNLMGALGLYCDLLSVPGVLKPVHRHYAEELRLVGSRSEALMQRLMLSSLNKSSRPVSRAPELPASLRVTPGAKGVLAFARSFRAEDEVSVRAIVERCSGLLSRVAGGRMIEISYGAAASLPVLVGEEAIERILVNLVRNSATAMDRREAEPGQRRASPPGASPSGAAEPGAAEPGAALRSDAVPSTAREPTSARHPPRSTVRERIADGTSDETAGAIRIGVGSLFNRGDDPRPWPFRRVRLTIEDSGCGMTGEQMERMTRIGRTSSSDTRGIGFRVVQELVASSGGDLRLTSACGVGTRVQIEWPLAALAGAKQKARTAAKGAADRRGVQC